MAQTSLFPEAEAAPTAAPAPPKLDRDLVMRRTVEVIASYAGELDRLRRAASGHFHSLADGKTYSRRPSFKVTVPSPASGPDEPDARLVISPTFDVERRRGEKPRITVPADTILLTLVHLDPRGDGRHRMVERIRIRLRPDASPHASRFWLATAEADASRACRTAAKFLEDPAAAVASSGSRCGICCRVLTDPESRARGIGPECHAAWVDFLHHCVWMDAAPDAAD